MIKPMLAYKYKEGKVDWEKKVYIQPKLDGVRCLISKDGAYSRTGKEFKNGLPDAKWSGGKLQN